MARLFYCNWNGTDLINSSPPVGEDAFASVLNEGSTWQKITGGGWGGANYAKADTKLQDRYCTVTLSSLARQGSCRVMFRVDTLGMDSGKCIMIMRLATSANTQAAVNLVNNSGSPRLTGVYRNTSNDVAYFDNTAVPDVPAGVDISTGTWYQIELIYNRNTAGGASFKVWNETGTTQVGTTQVCDGTTYNTGVDVETCRVGSISYIPNTVSSSGAVNNVMCFSRYEVWDDYAFPGPVVTSTTKFRKTLSSLGTQTGKRQYIGV